MKSIWTILAGIIVIAIALGIIYVYGGEEETGGEAAVRQAVMEFGGKLRMVSLLAPAEVVASEMDENYEDHLSAELLMAWKGDPTRALGRQTSSPYPDRIEIVEVVEENNESYRVEGNIIEITNADDPLHSVFGVQPVSMELEFIDGAWKIVSVEKGSYSEVPQQATYVGFWECLPHKAGETPTKECITGLAIDQSDGHIALDLSAASMLADDIRNGDKVRVSGTFVPSNRLSSDHWQRYDIDGVLMVTSFEKLAQ